MKIKLVSVESGISAIGFRKIAAIAKASEHDVEVLFVPTDNKYKTLSYMFPDNNARLTYKDIDIIGDYLAQADVVMFSSMTISKQYVHDIINRIKYNNINIKTVWGGAHPTLYPEEASKYADIICRGEGEEWTSAYLGVSNIQRHSYQGYDCKIYDFRTKLFRVLTPIDYAIYNGTLFRTLWTTGCPFSCSYCANDALISLDPGYKKLKYQSVDWIIEEIELALKQYPFVTTIAFDDDNFISLPLDVIIQFCVEWKKRINLPFVIYGMHPNTVDKQKVERLAQAGMNRCRMGIQSGSKNMLNMYNRTTTVGRIRESADILINIGREYNMVPPAFDIITDNPLQGIVDYGKTEKLLYDLDRPYTITLFSLRSFPGTKLYEKLPNLPTTPYTQTQPTMQNIILYLLTIVKPPRWLFDLMLKRYYVKYPKLHWIVKHIYHIKRGLDHITHGDWSRIGGKWGYWIWKLKNVKKGIKIN